MPSSRQRFGSWAESVAADFLCRRGYKILARHVTSRFGEIDILAMDGRIAVAVEVKAGKRRRPLSAVENITDHKLDRIHATIDDLMQKSWWPEERWRIDAITVESGHIEHYQRVG